MGIRISVTPAPQEMERQELLSRIATLEQSVAEKDIEIADLRVEIEALKQQSSN